MRTDSVVMATASQMGKSMIFTSFPFLFFFFPYFLLHEMHANRIEGASADAGLHLPWKQDIDRVLIPKGYSDMTKLRSLLTIMQLRADRQ